MLLATPPADAPTLPRAGRPHRARTPAWRNAAVAPRHDPRAADEEPSIAGSRVDTDTGATDVRFGRYRLLGVIGIGGTARVFAAHDTLLDQPVAVKRLHPEYVGSASARRWLAREVRLAQRIAHPAVGRVHDLGDLDGEPYVTMEYVPGRSLAAVLADAGPLPPADAVAIGRVLADALDAVHAAGVAHCDVKPENVLVGTSGRLVLVDFGVAVGLGCRATRGGTPGFMAPEQIAGGPVSRRTDVFGLAALLHAAIAGPALRDPGTWRPRRDCPPGLARILSWCLSPDPAHRLPTMGDLGRRLADVHRALVPDSPGRRWRDAPLAA